jgi:hypothetical protein
VIGEEAIRRGRGKPLGVARKEAIRRGERSCVTQGGEEDWLKPKRSG